MKTFQTVLLLALSVLLPSLDATALARRPVEQWAFFHFDGQAFVAGKPAEGAFIAVQDGVRPVVATAAEKVKGVKLHAGTGTVAGVCYVQASRGKLSSGPGYFPVPKITVEITDGERVVATAETDFYGYFVATLPSGSYKVNVGGTAQVKVENGKTTLISLRVGKRMVD